MEAHTSAPSTAPDWLTHVDEEEREELRALGIPTGALTSIFPDPGTAEGDALASVLLRRLHYIERDLERYETAEQREHAAIKWRYAHIVSPLVNRKRSYASALTELAARAIFAGKAKSRKLGWGVIGRRKLPDSIEVLDEKKVRAHLVAQAPDDTIVTATMTLKEARALLPRDMLQDTEHVEIGGMKLVKSIADEKGAHGVRTVVAAERPYFEVQAPDVEVTS